MSGSTFIKQHGYLSTAAGHAGLAPPPVPIGDLFFFDPAPPRKNSPRARVNSRIKSGKSGTLTQHAEIPSETTAGLRCRTCAGLRPCPAAFAIAVQLADGCPSSLTKTAFPPRRRPWRLRENTASGIRDQHDQRQARGHHLREVRPRRGQALPALPRQRRLRAARRAHVRRVAEAQRPPPASDSSRLGSGEGPLREPDRHHPC